jgi:hypothetical protein
MKQSPTHQEIATLTLFARNDIPLMIETESLMREIETFGLLFYKRRST